MNPPPLRWSRGYAAFAAVLSALAMPVRAGVGQAIPERVGVQQMTYAANLSAAPAGAPLSNPVTSHVGHGETVNLIIPRTEGLLVMTVSNAPVGLTALVLSADRKTFQATGRLGAVTVDDSRYLSEPGWSVSGQAGDFSGGGRTFSGGYLGWTPLVTTQNPDQDVVPGPALIPGANRGLKGDSLLAGAAATKGLGTTVLGATLYLEVPANTPIGSQSTTLTVTLVSRA
jgi:hypothetical protein